MQHDINGFTATYIRDRIEEVRKDAIAREYRQGQLAAGKSGPGPIRRKIGRAIRKRVLAAQAGHEARHLVREEYANGHRLSLDEAEGPFGQRRRVKVRGVDEAVPAPPGHVPEPVQRQRPNLRFVQTPSPASGCIASKSRATRRDR